LDKPSRYGQGIDLVQKLLTEALVVGWLLLRIAGRTALVTGHLCERRMNLHAEGITERIDILKERVANGSLENRSDDGPELARGREEA
jgi:hypothetical protein